MPDADDLPTTGAEFPVHLPVSDFVPVDFRPPKDRICARRSTVSWATMPKATIDKDNDAGSRKNEIRLSKKWVATTPTPNSVLPKDGN